MQTCTLTEGEQILLSMCAFTYQGSAIQVAFLLLCNINHIFIPQFQALLSYYSLVPSFFQGENDSRHLMTINTVSVWTGRKLQAWSEVCSGLGSC